LEAGIAEVWRQLKSDGERIAILQQEEKKEQEALQAVMTARKEKFDDKDVSVDQGRLAAIIRECREKSDAANILLTKAIQEESTCKADIEGVVRSMEERGARLSGDTAALERDANEAGFTSLELVRQAILQGPRARELGALRMRLNDSEQALVGRRTATNAAQEKLPGAAKEDAPLVDSITAHRGALEGERETLDQKFGALREELRQDDERRNSQLELSGQIGKAEIEFARWGQLSKLIGSATGNVFARFAQGLTLERLVAVANRHLVQLSPRYAMRRSNTAADDLELEIIDHYQGDVVRPMRSLSGGESFLASLALAVGLSELASGRTAIESLFIDEGFGSLDPAALEIAMAALEGLRTNGKTIGVISHVDAMKERIATQIQVHKREGGRSILEVRS
jgi:exonuclease SbcC